MILFENLNEHILSFLYDWNLQTLITISVIVTVNLKHEIHLSRLKKKHYKIYFLELLDAHRHQEFTFFYFENGTSRVLDSFL